MSKNGKEYELLIKIAGEVEKTFDSSLKSVEKSVKGFGNNLNSIDSQFSKMDKGFDNIMRAGKQAFDAIATGATIAATAISAASVAAVQTGVEFESAFAGVKKTVDATDEEFDRLREGIIEMTRTIPESASAIAGVMEIAGQLGIANDSLLDFTETMINLGVSTNMSAEDAATALAKFANIVNMKDFDENGTSNWERLGSTVVDLGNKFATTEEDIVNMSMRLASTGHLAGLSEADILGLSTAMSAVGIKAEAGGSAMAKLLKKIQVAVETNSESLEDYAKVANMSVDEFSTAFKDNAVGALSAFIGGLNDTERNGMSAIAVLDDMGLKEVRLSNMILALAGSETVMTDAVKIANEAWGENAALTEEAQKRYETVESQATLVKNALQELGIQAYDEMRPLIVDALTEAKEALHDLIDSGALRKIISDLSGKLPTIKRLFDTNIGGIIDKAQNAMKWILQNGDKIAGIVTTIGAGLAMYKLSSDLIHGLNALSIFFTFILSNPVAAVLFGIAAGIAAAAGAIVQLKLEEERLKNESLDDHFGDMALSLSEVQKVAESIMGSGTFSKLREAMEQYGELEGIAGSIKNATDELDKLNFKVSVGIQLSEGEQEQYKTAIDSFVTECQNYVVQQQRAVNIGLEASFTEEQLEESNVIGSVNQFYERKYSELSELGGKLRDAVNDAFRDGLLTFDELETINNLRGQIEEIQKFMASIHKQATYDTLWADYFNGDMSAESYSNVLAKLTEMQTQGLQDAKDNYENTLAALEAAREDANKHAVGEGRKKLNNRYYDNLEAQALENYTFTGDQELFNSFNFGTDVLKSNYQKEVSDAIIASKDYVQQTIRDNINIEEALKGEPMRWGQIFQDLFYDLPGAIDDAIAPGDKSAIGEKLKEMAPTAEQVQETKKKWEEAGKELPEGIADGIASYNAMNILTGGGTQEDIWSVIGSAIAEDPELLACIEQAKESGVQIPEGIAQAITDAENEGKITEQVGALWNFTDGEIRNVFEGRTFFATASVNVKLELGEVDASAVENIGNNYGSQTVPAHGTTKASGGIVNFKTISWLAEDGPEAVIPLDGSDNALSLWAQAGKLLGIGDDNNSAATANTGLEMVDTGSSMDITYSPQFIFNGDAPSKQDMVDAAHISQKEFDQMMQEWQKKNRRTKFAS